MCKEGNFRECPFYRCPPEGGVWVRRALVGRIIRRQSGAGSGSALLTGRADPCCGVRLFSHGRVIPALNFFSGTDHHRETYTPLRRRQTAGAAYSLASSDDDGGDPDSFLTPKPSSRGTPVTMTASCSIGRPWKSVSS
jgi:hypothetical protein